MAYIASEKVRQIGFLILLLILGGFLAYSLQSFLSAFCGAVILYVLLRKPHLYLISQKKIPSALSASLLLLLSFFLLLLPFLGVILLLTSKVSYVVAHYQELADVLNRLISQTQSHLPADFWQQIPIDSIASSATSLLPTLVSGTASMLSTILSVYFILFFMMLEARKMEAWVREEIPLHTHNTQLLLHELKNATYSNAVAMVLLAILQGLFAGIGYWVAGIPESLLWAVITGIFSFIPFVGATVVWIPLCLFLWVSGYPFFAAGLALYAVLVLGNLDNLLRFYIQKKFSNTHPLITLFGVIMGVKMLGFVGLVFGPLLISYFILLLRIYRNEFGDKRQ
jgi:predicted PurR-regulated permease PerM